MTATTTASRSLKLKSTYNARLSLAHPSATTTDRVHIYEITEIPPDTPDSKVLLLAEHTAMLDGPGRYSFASLGEGCIAKRLPASTVHEIRPYVVGDGTAPQNEFCGKPWAFDDPARGIKQEWFVLGGERLMDYASRDVPNADAGFRLLFSDAPFDGAEVATLRERTPELAENGGIYEVPGAMLDGEPVSGWLCPTTLAYFEQFPARLYFKGLPLG